jgi:hypothetical protein
MGIADLLEDFSNLHASMQTNRECGVGALKQALDIKDFSGKYTRKYTNAKCTRSRCVTHHVRNGCRLLKCNSPGII